MYAAALAPAAQRRLRVRQAVVQLMSEHGFRFSMDAVTDLRMEPRDLGERGIRYVKVPGQFLMSEHAATSSDIHAADLSDLLGRFAYAVIVIELAAQLATMGLKRGLAQQLAYQRATGAPHDRHPVERSPLELGARRGAQVVAAQDLGAVHFRESFQAAGQVHGVAGDGVLEALRRADVADDDLARVQADANP